jgi:hypothetical protein
VDPPLTVTAAVGAPINPYAIKERRPERASVLTLGTLVAREAHLLVIPLSLIGIGAGLRAKKYSGRIFVPLPSWRGRLG